jgi:hypothetical protein
MLLSAAGEMLAAILSHASDESGLKADWGTSDLGPNKNTMSERRGPNLEAEL